MAVGDQNNGVRAGLRPKFVVAFALQTVVIAALLVGIQQWLVRQAMIRQTVEQGRAVANTIESTAGYYVLFGLTDDLRNIVTDVGRTASVDYADFTTADGKPLAASKPQVPPSLEGHALRREQGATIGGDAHLFIVPFYENRADAQNPNAKAKGYFRLVLNESQARQATRSILNWNLLATALVLSLATALAAFLVAPLII
ncbi:MAG TPA: hypothetical protein VF698_16605, partial [Thermoanaerobaculia bacterium]